MAVTFAAAIAQARVWINDSAAGSQRFLDAVLLGFGKDGITETANACPQLFKVDGTFNTVAGITQSLPNPGRSLYVIDLYESIVAGLHAPLYACDLEALRKYKRTWTFDAAGQAENWIRYPSEGSKRDAAKFMLYPASPGPSQAVFGSWVEVPDMAAYTVNTDIPLTDDLAPAIQSYIAYRAENLNEEASSKSKAADYYATFRGLLGLQQATKEPKS